MAQPELPESRLYTFIDETREFALYFLEGQKLIHDLALLHGGDRNGFAYFRDVVLSIQPLIALLKHGEQLGFYIDSEEPYFRVKIETGHHGATRCALVPESLERFPEEMTGKVRLLKLFPRNKPPYQSVLEVDSLRLGQIVNRVLDHSYQVNSAIVVSEKSDQSLMLHQLPPLPGKDDYDLSPEALRERRAHIGGAVDRIFARALHGEDEVVQAFKEIGFRALSRREVHFRCSCSKQRMVEGILLAVHGRHEQLFDPGQTALECICEYCKSRYYVTRDDLNDAASPIN